MRGMRVLPGMRRNFQRHSHEHTRLEPPPGIANGSAKFRGSRVGIDRLVDVADRGLDLSIGERKDDRQLLTDFDLVGIKLADAPLDPEMVEWSDLHQEIGGGVGIPLNDGFHDNNTSGTRT